MSGPVRSQLYLLSRRINNFYLSEYQNSTYLPFLCENVQVGFISPQVKEQLQNYPDVFDIRSKYVTFNKSLDSPAVRSTALETVLLKMKSENIFSTLNGWRNECYETRSEVSGPLMFKMERSACPLFGVRTFGIHITGYVNHSTRGLCVWFQKRSETKQTWPGMFGI